jgi:hypothetical protein
MIRVVSVLQVPLSRYVDWFIALCYRPVRCFLLGLKSSDFMTTNDDGVVDSIGARIGG